MAYINANRAAHVSLADRFTGIVKSVKEAFHRRRVYNTTRNELAQLSNRELADLGISRSMISRIALEAAYGE